MMIRSTFFISFSWMMTFSSTNYSQNNSNNNKNQSTANWNCNIKSSCKFVCFLFNKRETNEWAINNWCFNILFFILWVKHIKPIILCSRSCEMNNIVNSNFFITFIGNRNKYLLKLFISVNLSCKNTLHGKAVKFKKKPRAIHGVPFCSSHHFC